MTNTDGVHSRPPEVETARFPKMLTAEQVAELLEVPLSSIYEAARQNRIGGVVRIGRKVRFDLAGLRNWIDSGGQALPGGWKRA